MERAVQLEAAGRHIVHLEIGQPDFGAPAAVRAAAASAIRTDALGYGPTLGLPALRAALSQAQAERDALRQRVAELEAARAAQPESVKQGS